LINIASAIKNPGATNRPSLLRLLVGEPRIFDIVSLLLQWRDSGRIRKAIGAYISDDLEVRKTHDHNLKQLGKFTRTRRAEPFYQVLTANIPEIKNKKLLIIGGRSVQEFLLAWTFGLKWENMIGIDLFSSNKKILVMNMEAMTFPNDSFDLITAINVLGYTSGIEIALREYARVLKPGGRLVFDHTCRPGDADYPSLNTKGSVIAEILKSAKLEIYFHESKDKIESRGFRQTAHIFGCRKIQTDENILDIYRPY